MNRRVDELEDFTSDLGFFKTKSELLEKKIKCKICNEKDKEYILECNHMMCEECLNKNLDSRTRTCPFDRSKISKGNVRKLIWDNDAK